MAWRRFATFVLLGLLCGSSLDRCVIACTQLLGARAVDTREASVTCHHDTSADAASASDGSGKVMNRVCAHEHETPPGELLTVRTAGDQTRASAPQIIPAGMAPVLTHACDRVERDGPPRVVLESGSERRQLRL